MSHGLTLKQGKMVIEDFLKTRLHKLLGVFAPDTYIHYTYICYFRAVICKEISPLESNAAILTENEQIYAIS